MSSSTNPELASFLSAQGCGGGLLNEVQREIMKAAIAEHTEKNAPPTSGSTLGGGAGNSSSGTPHIGSSDTATVLSADGSSGTVLEAVAAEGGSLAAPAEVLAPSSLVGAGGGRVSQGHHQKSVGVAVKQERKSHSAVNGRPKKGLLGGGGGRGTWGNPLDPNNYVLDIDKGDPVYESDEEPYQPSPLPVSETVESFKRKVIAVVDEFFTSSSINDAALELRDLSCPSYHHHFVKKLISLSLDRHDREKELAAELLSALYADVISREQISKGFSDVLEGAEEFLLDCPDAVEIISLFLARAVVDDILPPAFLNRAAKELPDGGAGLAAVRKAEARLARPDHAEVVERVWGGTGRVTVEGARIKIGEILKEFAESGDMNEVERSIRELNLPFFHHEVVKAALVLAMEQPSREPVLLAFLRGASEGGLFSSNQVEKGFSRIRAFLHDLALDIPSAPAAFARFVSAAKAEAWLGPSFSAAEGGADGARLGPGSGEGAGQEEEEDQHAQILVAFKKKASAIVCEFFDSGDVEEVSRSLEELGYPDFYNHFVKRLVTTAMDRKNREREMASQLLSALCPHTLPHDQVESAVIRLLEAVDDLALDIPDAANQLALFIARAVVDDILAPQFIAELAETFKAGEGGEGGGSRSGNASKQLAHDVVLHVRVSISARHAAERILRCWGGSGGGVFSSADAKEQIHGLLEEFQVAGDLKEASRCIRELNMSFFHHEIVRKALVKAMEKQSERQLELMRECSEEGLISSSQMLKGFVRVADELPDLVLDIPDAYSRLAQFVEKAQSQKWLSAEFTCPPPPPQPLVSEAPSSTSSTPIPTEGK